MLTIVSSTPCEKPAFRSAANDEPYSTIRFSSRFHHESDGMWWTSGPRRSRSSVRQTGVSDGKTDVARRYRRAREVRERRGAAAFDGVLERLRRHPVDDDQDELLRHERVDVIGERAEAPQPQAWPDRAP